MNAPCSRFKSRPQIANGQFVKRRAIVRDESFSNSQENCSSNNYHTGRQNYSDG